MRFLIFGDIFGRIGRRCLAQYFPHAIEQYKPDAIIVNGENSAGGFGITKKVYQEFMDMGVTCITTGNHWADKKEIFSFLPEAGNLILPGNMSNVKEKHPGYKLFPATKDRPKFAVINLIGRVFMNAGNECPFNYADHLLEELRDVKIKLIDMHAETTSEKYAIAQYLKGRVSMLWGTHTHVPTADAHIMGEKTGYMTDIGMTGPFDSVIGIKSEASIARFIGAQKRSFEPAKKDPWCCGLIADISDTSGYCGYLEPFIWRNPIH